jgi:hypothetical protein
MNESPRLEKEFGQRLVVPDDDFVEHHRRQHRYRLHQKSIPADAAAAGVEKIY